MNRSETINELASALVKFQAEVGPAQFNKVNPFLKNKYADLGGIIATAKPVLEKHGLAVTQLVTGELGEVGVETTLIHASGQWISSCFTMPLGEERGKSSAQVAGSIITYMRRYSLAAILGIYSDEDTDGTPANGIQPERKVSKQKAEKAMREIAPDAKQARSWHGDIIKAVVPEYFDNPPNAISVLYRLGLPEDCTTEQVVEKSKAYRSERDSGKSVDEAIAKAKG